MGALFTIIVFIYLGAAAILTVIGERVVDFLCKKSDRIRNWFDALPMNMEEYDVDDQLRYNTRIFNKKEKDRQREA